MPKFWNDTPFISNIKPSYRLLIGNTDNSAANSTDLRTVNEFVTAVKVTYEQLKKLIANSELIIGKKYVITDYQTIYTQPVTGSVMTGTIEPLMVEARTVNGLSPLAISALYPKDIIFYTFANETDKYDFLHATSKGFISRRITRNDIDLPYDFRNIKFKRFAIDMDKINPYADGKNFKKGDVVKNIAGTDIYVCNADVTGSASASPSNSLYYWTMLYPNAGGEKKVYYALAPEDIKLDIQNQTMTIPVKATDFKQCYTFHYAANDTDYSNLPNAVNSVKIGLAKNGEKFTLNNVVFFSYEQKGGFKQIDLGCGSKNCTIGENCQSMTAQSMTNTIIGQNCLNNFWGAKAEGNIIGSNFQNNILGSNFHGNYCGNNISNCSVGNNFNENILIGNHDGLHIANTCSGNVFKKESRYATIGNYLTGCIIPQAYFLTILDGVERVDLSQFTSTTANTLVQRGNRSTHVLALQYQYEGNAYVQKQIIIQKK